MKSLILGTILVVLTLLQCSGGEWAHAGSYTGDVNCNNRVDVVDAQLILQQDAHVIEVEDFPNWCWDKGDVNDDEQLDTVDAQLILQLDARLIDFFPF